MSQLNGQTLDHLLGPPETADYRPQACGVPAFMGFGWKGYGFDLTTVGSMMMDPVVDLGIRMLKSPIETAEGQWEVQGEPEVVEYVKRQLRRFWRASLKVALTCIEYGYSASEAIYYWDEQEKRIHFDYLRQLHPRDVAAMSDGPVLGGIKIKGSAGRGHSTHATGKQLDAANYCEQRRSPGMPAKGFWVWQGNAYNLFYGQSRLLPAWVPWRDKTGQDGALDIVRMWFYKCAYSGVIIWHPERDLRNGDGTYVPARDMARQMAEWLKTGAVVALPNVYDKQTGNRLWEIEQPRPNGSADYMLDYVTYLNTEILRGIGLPDSIITDAGGSGSYSGRKVPEDAFYTSEETILHQIIHTFDDQIIRGLVFRNFGKGHLYDIEPLPLVPIRQQQAAQEAIGRNMGAAGGPAGAATPQQGPTTLADLLGGGNGGGPGLPPGGELGQAQAPENRVAQVGLSLVRKANPAVDLTALARAFWHARGAA